MTAFETATRTPSRPPPPRRRPLPTRPLRTPAGAPSYQHLTTQDPTRLSPHVPTQRLGHPAASRRPYDPAVGKGLARQAGRHDRRKRYHGGTACWTRATTV